MKLTLGAHELLLRLLRNPMVILPQHVAAKRLIALGFAKWGKRSRLEITEQGKNYLRK